MIRDEHHTLLSAEEVAPAVVDAADGWQMAIRFVGGDLTGSDGVCLFRADFEPGSRHERHVHSAADEIFYVISGRAAVGAGEREYLAEAGSVQHIPRGKVHWLRNVGDEPVEVVGVYVGGSSLEATGYDYVGPVEERHRQVV